MSRRKIRIHTDSSDLAFRIGGCLTDLIEPAPEAQTIFEDNSGWTVEAYFEDPVEPHALRASLADLIGLTIPTLELSDVPELNWVRVSQSALPPVRAGRFLVHGTHDRKTIARGPFTIEIDAGEAFGTAHHATTRGCLEALDRISRRRNFRSVLDIGCGSGVLALAAHRACPSAHVTAIDNDPVAVEVARANMRNNGAGYRVAVRIGTGADAAGRSRAHDLVLANILAAPLISMAGAVRKAVSHGGLLVLSGLLDREAMAVIAAYQSQEFHIAFRTTEAGWSTLVLCRSRGVPCRAAGKSAGPVT